MAFGSVVGGLQGFVGPYNNTQLLASPLAQSELTSYQFNLSTGYYSLAGGTLITGTYSFFLDTGTYNLTGETLLQGSVYTLASGTYNVTGQNLSQAGYNFPLASGTYSVGGKTFTANLGYTLNSGTYTLTGKALAVAVSPAPIVGIGLGKSGGNVILDAKKADEVINFPFDYTSNLAANETISSFAVSVSVYSGTDPNPALLVVDPGSIVGGIVHQPISGGIEGNVYVITILASTSLAQEIEIDAFVTII